MTSDCPYFRAWVDYNQDDSSHDSVSMEPVFTERVSTNGR